MENLKTNVTVTHFKTPTFSQGNSSPINTKINREVPDTLSSYRVYKCV